MNAADLVLLVLLAAAVFFALRHIRRMRKSGCACGNAGGCTYTGKAGHRRLAENRDPDPGELRAAEPVSCGGELMPQSVRSPCRAQTPL